MAQDTKVGKNVEVDDRRAAMSVEAITDTLAPSFIGGLDGNSFSALAHRTNAGLTIIEGTSVGDYDTKHGESSRMPDGVQWKAERINNYVMFKMK